LAKVAGNVWEHEEHYRTLVRRQAELVDALDLTKNQAAAQLATESEETETVASPTPAEDASEEAGVEVTAPSARQNPGEKTVPELMTPKQFKAAGLGPANDAIVLKAARLRKQVSAQAVDEYNLRASLPRGYVREGDRFVFRIQSATHRERVNPAPALMTPTEARMVVTVSLSSKDAWARFPGRERWLSPGSKKKDLAIERAHRGEITRALQAGEPISAAAVEAYKIVLPDGYEREGDRFVSTGAAETSSQRVAPTVATTRVSRRNSTQRKMAA
jgi:hypothetical protein